MSRSDDDDFKTTRTMQRRLFTAPDFETFARDNAPFLSPLPICDFLTALCEIHGRAVGYVIKNSGIDRTYGYQLFNGTRQPSREKLLQLAFGIGLDVEETQRMLKTAQKSPLYPLILRDAAILRCLNDGCTFEETQELLCSMELTPLGGEERHE